MPLRVKCRCGQELVLRFNEWVYALFGLLVLSLLVNGTALVFLVLKLSAPPRPEGSPEVAREAGSPVLPPRSSVAEPLSQAEPLEAMQPEPPGHAAEPDLAPARPEAMDESPPPPGEQIPDSRVGQALVVKPERLPRLLLPESRLPLERVLVVGRAEEPRLLLAFLYDDDPVVRRSALRKLLQAPPPADRDSLRDQLSIALPAASLFFGDGGPELFRRLSGGDHGADLRAWQEWGQKALGIDPERRPAAEALSPLQVWAQALLVSSPAAQALWKLFQGTGETDLLLALDVTESMEEPLQALARSEWLPHAIAWSIPRLRVGCFSTAMRSWARWGWDLSPRRLCAPWPG